MVLLLTIYVIPMIVDPSLVGLCIIYYLLIITYYVLAPTFFLMTYYALCLTFDLLLFTSYGAFIIHKYSCVMFMLVFLVNLICYYYFHLYVYDCYAYCN